MRKTIAYCLLAITCMGAIQAQETKSEKVKEHIGNHFKPYGFILDDKHLRRAGMDYWKHLDLHEYDSWEDFLERNPAAELRFFSTRGEKSYWNISYPDGVHLVFGSESCGLPPDFYSRYRDRLCTIPMPGKFSRSLNLANSAALAIYEGLRQNGL